MNVKAACVKRIHRLRRKQEIRTRPVIVRLCYFNEQVQLLRNVCAIVSTEVLVLEDYSWRVQKICRNFRPTVKDSTR